MSYIDKYQELVELSHSDNLEIKQKADNWLISIGLQDAAELKVLRSFMIWLLERPHVQHGCRTCL